MKAKFLNVTSLALLQIVIVANLQPLAANAIHGFSLPFLYVLGAIGFFIPCILMVSKLATSHPQTGGAYIWVEQAFGKKMGFFTVALLWISNLLWYPSFFSLIASNAAYIINPEIADNKIFILSFATGLFWLITLLNCLGIKISTLLSMLAALIGIIFPMLLIVLCGGYWWLSGNALAISLNDSPLIPSVTPLSNLGFFIAVTMSFFGIEIPAVHAGNVMNPKQDFPKSLWISGGLIFILTLLSSMAISMIVPPAELSVVTGLLDAIRLFFHEFQWGILLSFVFLLIFIGNMGSVMAWMLGSTRGMFVACLNNHVSNFLQKTNRNEAPIGVLIFEAILFTGATCVFFAFPRISDSFWLLLVLASQVTLVYYVILFFSSIKLLKYSLLFSSLMILGGLTSLLSLIFGFFPPSDLPTEQVHLFQLFLIIGLTLAMGLPLILLKLKNKEP